MDKKLKLIKIIEKTTNHKLNNKNIDLIKSGILDSFFIIKIVVEIEKEFKIKIPKKKITLKNFSNIKNLIKII